MANKKSSKKTSDPNTYTKPQLRDRIKKKVAAGDKGGDPGQWSARKAQLVAQEYEQAGGDYKKPRGPAQKSLEKWGGEHASKLPSPSRTTKKGKSTTPARKSAARKAPTKKSSTSTPRPK